MQLSKNTTFFNDLAHVTRDHAADVYRKLMIENWGTGVPVDWQTINNAIVSRWSLSALEYIKKKAWHQPCCPRMVYIIAKNNAFKYDVFRVKITNAGTSIGYSTRREAVDTLKRYRKPDEINPSLLQ
jgi:hypothetical protein